MQNPLAIDNPVSCVDKRFCGVAASGLFHGELPLVIETITDSDTHF
ncbi:hypothetical protein N9271_02120 [Pseudomonadales bacterium]|nr:hypothetical protein [Pseudomonadales bacterium]